MKNTASFGGKNISETKSEANALEDIINTETNINEYNEDKTIITKQ